MPTSLSYATGRIQNPDGTPARGEVIFASLSAPTLPDAAPPAQIALRDVRIELDAEGDVSAALVAGPYSVAFRLAGASRPSFNIVLAPEHTIDAPLDLALAAPIVPSPIVKFVVNELVHREALEAAASAAHDAEATAAARAAVDHARAAADAAQLSAQSASASASSASADAASAAAQVAADRDLVAAMRHDVAWSYDPDDADVVVLSVPDSWIDEDDALVVRMPVGSVPH